MDAIYTIGEIAATLFAFTAIIIAIGTPSPEEKDALFGVIAGAVMAMLFAFLPAMLSGGAAELTESEWRLACGIFGWVHFFVAHVGYVIVFLDKREVDKRLLIFNVCSWPVIGLKILVGFGIATEFAYQAYVAGLIWSLLASLYFYLAYFILGRGEDST